MSSLDIIKLSTCVLNFKVLCPFLTAEKQSREGERLRIKQENHGLVG